MAALTLEMYEGTGQFKGDPVTKLGFPAFSTSKEPAWNAADLGSIPGVARFPGEGNGYPL